MVDNGNGEQALAALWRQAVLPVVFRRARPSPLLVKIPYAVGNMDWLRNGEPR